MNITVTDTNVSVVSPYNAKFIAGAKQINGKWNKPAWEFPKENEDLVRNLLRDVYGTDGTPESTVTILVKLPEAEWLMKDATFMVGPFQALRKLGRDTTPRLGENCTIIQGKLLSSGGSRNNPRITFTNDCVMRIKNVPQSVANSLIEKDDAAFSIVDDEEQNVIEWSADELSAIATLKTMNPDRLAQLLKELQNEQ